MKNLCSKKRFFVICTSVLAMVVLMLALIGCSIDDNNDNNSSKIYQVVGSPYVSWSEISHTTNVQIKIKNLTDKAIVAKFIATDSNGNDLHSKFIYIDCGETKTLTATSKTKYGHQAKFDFQYIVNKYN